jgi:hypothetical protein
MRCQDYHEILEREPDGPLPDTVTAHLDTCDACRGLAADLAAIHAASLDLGAVQIEPPERVWLAVRQQLEAEGIIREARPAPATAAAGWWTILQRPALAGAFLSLLLSAAGLISYRSDIVGTAVHRPLMAKLESSVVPSAGRILKEELATIVTTTVPGFSPRDPAVTESFRRNLDIVDNFIAMCEKSVREQPDNEMAREYLYGAYEQKAALLSTAMARSTMGGLE